MSRYSLQDYTAYIKMSNNRHLLVEGKQDRRLFTELLDVAFRDFAIRISRDEVNIDVAQDLIGTGFQDTRGNRQKVELVSEAIGRTADRKKFVGFVDREFRGFEWGDRFADHINGHYVLDRLVWSRGHSVENYYFDLASLQGPLRAFSRSHRFGEALALFQVICESVIRFACAASLAGLELNMITVLRRSLHWRLVDLGPSGASIRTEEWKESLRRNQKLTEEMARLVIERYESWVRRVEAADFGIIRWLCHGHVGLSCIWAAYARCVYETCEHTEDQDRGREAQHVLAADEDVRFNVCLQAWAGGASTSAPDCPSIVFDLLGLSPPSHESSTQARQVDGHA
jgi:hypothetical protein